MPGGSLSEEDFIRIARDGTTSLIEAAVKNRVKRVVVTSSVTTMVGKIWKKESGETMYSEKDFTPLDENLESYGKNKVI
jgi:nucleoside-diphosphate-sugar epimerase